MILPATLLLLIPLLVWCYQNPEEFKDITGAVGVCLLVAIFCASLVALTICGLERISNAMKEPSNIAPISTSVELESH
jgi:hypothetical protein